MNKTEFFSAIKSGSIDFSHATPADRTIDADWLSEVLSVADRHLKLTNALVTGRFGLQSANVNCASFFVDCIFDDVQFDYCTFTQWSVFSACQMQSLHLKGCHFSRGFSASGTSIAKNVMLAYTTADRDIAFDKCLIGGEAELAGMKVVNNLHMRYATFTSRFNLSLTRVEGQVNVTGSRFSDDVIVFDSTFGALFAEDVTFAGKASLDRSSVTSSIFLQRSSFQNEASFAGITAKGQFVVNGCVFHKLALFDGLRVDSVIAQGVQFLGEASFNSMKSSSIECIDADFLSSFGMQDARIEVGAVFGGCRFSGDGHFERTIVGGSLVIRPSDQRSVVFSQLASFNGTQVGAQVILDRVEFDSDLYFESVHIGAGLFLIECSVKKTFKLVASEIRGNIECSRTKFDGNVDATNSSVTGHAIFWHSTFLEAPQLTRIVVATTLNFTDATLPKGINLDLATVGGRTLFHKAKIKGTFSANMATLQTLAFDAELAEGEQRSEWQFSEVTFQIGGLKYDRLDVHWRPFIEAFRESLMGSDQQPYRELETSLRSRGKDKWADQVYFAGRKHAAESYGGFSTARFGDAFARYISGYGVHPEWIAAWAGFLLLIGTLFFWLFHGAARPVTIAARHYHCDEAPAFFQALGLTLKALTPGDSKVLDGWTISDCRLLPIGLKPFVVVGLLQVCAAILIPFLVAQIGKIWQYGGRG